MSRPWWKLTVLPEVNNLPNPVLDVSDLDTTLPVATALVLGAGERSGRKSTGIVSPADSPAVNKLVPLIEVEQLSR
jgi:hypothetical protein